MAIEGDEDRYEKKVERAVDLIAGSEALVVFTGAGTSTGSGLPDYRGPEGVWTRRDKGLPPPESKPMGKVEPNEAHYSIVALQELGKLTFLISQNVDNLHLRSGIDPERIAELHGNHALMRCMECDMGITFEEAGWDKKEFGEGYRTQEPTAGQPACPRCGGRLISSIVNFGDPLPRKELSEAMEHSVKSDVFLVIGSSLVVSPARDMPLYALENGAKLIIVNRGETPFDDICRLRFWSDAGRTMEDIAEGVRVRVKGE